jgi:hypothetical protein
MDAMDPGAQASKLATLLEELSNPHWQAADLEASESIASVGKALETVFKFAIGSYCIALSLWSGPS